MRKTCPRCGGTGIVYDGAPGPGGYIDPDECPLCYSPCPPPCHECANYMVTKAPEFKIKCRAGHKLRPSYCPDFKKHNGL